MSRVHAIAVPAPIRLLVDQLASAQVADDQRWILTLMRRQGPVVVSMLWRMLGCEADVLDAYQSAICNLTAKGKNHIGANRAGYFYRASLNAGVEILRRRKTRSEHWLRVVDAHEGRSHPATPSASFDRVEETTRLREAIGRLPAQLRNVIVLRDLAELPYRKVAKTLGIQVTTARLYRRQAVVRLAALIGEEGQP